MAESDAQHRVASKAASDLAKKSRTRPLSMIVALDACRALGAREQARGSTTILDYGDARDHSPAIFLDGGSASNHARCAGESGADVRSVLGAVERRITWLSRARAAQYDPRLVPPPRASAAALRAAARYAMI